MRLAVLYMMVLCVVAGCKLKDPKAHDVVHPVSAGAIKKQIDSNSLTTILWLDSIHRDFGKIAEGQKLNVVYHFKNSGTKPLVISKVQPSCGCTVAEQPNDPVAPGDEGVIKATFNSEGRTGLNHKTLFVIANTKGSYDTQLEFTVQVDKKKW